jgi:signal transduction histidine kinase
MVFTLISLTAAVNIILGILALSKGRSSLNLSFAFLSFLLGFWNVCVVLWQGYNLPEFSRVNGMIIAFIPPAGLLFTMNLYKLNTGFVKGLLRLILVLGLVVFLLAVLTFFSKTVLDIYNSYAVRFAIVVYEFVALVAALALLIRNLLTIKFKQEKIKTGYVIIAFIILFIGGMLDFTGGLEMHNIKYAGNYANAIYAMMIFFAIFQMRLFDAGLVFRNFLVYFLVAVLMCVIFTLFAVFFHGQVKFLASVYFVLSFAMVFYAKKLHNVVVLFLENIGGRSGTDDAKKAFAVIRASQSGEEEKIKATAGLIKNCLEIDTAVYVREGGYYLRRWVSDDSVFQAAVEWNLEPRSGYAVRYDETVGENKAMLDLFEADIVFPLSYAGRTLGVIAGKKQTADISFTEDEVELLNDIAAGISSYLNAHSLQQRLLAEENMKRIGLMARQMAHEIKNPLAALWGAAQLIEARTDLDREYIGIIRDEISRLTGILDSWKDFSGSVKLKKSNVDLMELMSEVVKMVNLSGKNTAFDFRRKEGASMPVVVDYNRMKQVFLNIILNAVDAMESVEKPEIMIDIVKKDGAIDVKVRDNGTGIKKEMLDKVKQPLFTTRSKGTGLGLAISDRIVTEHGGALIVKSDGMSYTEVTVEIPG